MDQERLYADRGLTWRAIVVVKFAMGIFGLVLALMAVGKGGGIDKWGLFGLIGLVGFGFGGVDLYNLTRKTVLLTFSPEGILDHRLAHPVLLPWSGIVRITPLTGGDSGFTAQVEVNSSVDLKLFGGPGTRKDLLSSSHLVIDLGYVGVTAPELIKLVKRFAPQVDVSRIFGF